MENDVRKLYVTLDAEWSDVGFISLQVGVFSANKLLAKAFIIEENITTEELKVLYQKIGQNAKTEIIFTSFGDSINVLEDYLVDLLETKLSFFIKDVKKLQVNVIFFYSPKDLEAAFGFDNIVGFYKSEMPKSKNSSRIIQLRSIFGSFNFKTKVDGTRISYKLKDLAGFTNSGLLNLAQSFGVEMPSKTILDDYKSKMEIPFREHPKDFFEYSMQDSLKLKELLDTIIVRINNLMEEARELPSFLLFSLWDFPSSTGKMVSIIFYRYLIYWALGKPESLEDYESKKLKLDLAFSKISILNSSSKNYKENVKVWNKVFNHSSTEKILNFVKENNLQDHSFLKSGSYLVHPVSYGSISWFLMQDSISSTCFNSLVSGGRCVNEKWDQNYFKYCIIII